jgi:glycosyltransferase involved in cell wall biosynthesis
MQAKTAVASVHLASPRQGVSIRVVHVASAREWRGGQRQVWFTARALGRIPDIDQVVVTSRGSMLQRRLEQASVPVLTPRWTIGLDPRALGAILSTCRQSDILHAHDSHALILAGVAARLRGCRFVATRRTAFPLSRPGFWNRADRVIAISDAVGQMLRESGLSADRVTVIRSAIDLDAIQMLQRIDPRAMLGLGPDTLIAIAVGALDRHKGQDTVIAAAAETRARLPNLHWVLAGEGERRAALESQIQSLGLDENVHLLGHIADAEALIGGADVMVATPIQEGLGTAILDAMALGVPVVASETGGIPELVGGGAGLLVPPRSPVDVANAVVRILTQRDACQAMVRLAAERVTDFSDTRMADALASVYRSMQKEVGDP